MRSVILQQPEISFEQYLSHDDGTDDRYELVNGVLEQMPPPTGLHGDIICFLFLLFHDQISQFRLPWLVRPGMVGVRTGVKSSRLPDLVIITEQQRQIIRDVSAIVETAPILAIEVVSPDHPQRDYQDKKQEYARVGIPEYWIVDPIGNQILVLILQDKQYQQNIYKNDEVVQSLAFPELKVSANQILEANLYGGQR